MREREKRAKLNERQVGVTLSRARGFRDARGNRRRTSYDMNLTASPGVLYNANKWSYPPHGFVRGQKAPWVNPRGPSYFFKSYPA